MHAYACDVHICMHMCRCWLHPPSYMQECMYVQVRLSVCMHARTHARTHGRKDDGWMDGWTDGWKEGWIDGWMDGWMDGSPSWLCSDTGVFGRIIVFSILTTVTIIVTARTRTAIIAVLAASPSCMAVTLLVL